MSLLTLNEENISDDTPAESCAILCMSPEASSRPSILRPSQKENIPPEGIVKPMKVTFQTPLRDPQTRRILSQDTRKSLETSQLGYYYAEVPEDLVLPPFSVIMSQFMYAPNFFPHCFFLTAHFWLVMKLLTVQ
uniref:Uncharacterized protein n=1 Tax=Salvator merianae TaxID=96440 RepID=A0A8D0KP99_SALMN